MSVTYKSYAVLGYRISVNVLEDKLIKKEKVRLCTHPNQTGKYCNECGKPVWGESTNYGGVVEALEELKITWVSNGADSNDYCIGIYTEDSDYTRDSLCIRLDNLEEYKKSIDAWMIKLGLNPNDFNFGVWAVQYCSY